MVLTQQHILSAGMLLIFLGFLILFIGSIFLSPQKTNAKYSVVGFIGPFPIGFGNDKKLMFFTLILAVVLIVIFSLFFNIKR
ncbi:DUF131 domain-containing protein [Candidatus Woesearchaeota archaeon]|nr:DUF131 domain-containing protein [Candidatus Woesearchaeota archaeon]